MAKTKKNLTKSELIAAIVAELPGVDRKHAKLIPIALAAIAQRELKRHGTFKVHGLCVLMVKNVPARKGGKMVKNPFTGEQMKQKARPASKSVRARAEASLKRSVNE